MINYLELPIGDRCPEVIEAVIEIPFEGINKYEYDKKLHVFRLDRNLYSPVHYPGDYGFIPSTLSEDGDPLDVLVLVDAPSFSGCVMQVRPIGVLEMLDQGMRRREDPRCRQEQSPLHRRVELLRDLSAHPEGDHSLLLHLQGSRRQARRDQRLEGRGSGTPGRHGIGEALPRESREED